MCSDDRLFTLASGSEPSSGTQLSRVAYRVGRLHQAHGEKRRELPSLYSEALKKKNVNRKFRRLERIDDFQCFVQLSVGPSPKRFRRVLGNKIRLDALTLDTLSLPGIPACDGHAEYVAASDLEVCASENLTRRSRADDCGEAILLRKASDHLRCAVRVFVDENHGSTVEGLRAQALRDEGH